MVRDPSREPSGSHFEARADSDEVVDILLIDDSQDYLFLIRRTLEGHDPRYRVTGVSSPEEADPLLEQRSFHLVLLDYKFRQGNGLEVIRSLKGKTDYIPTVMVTAFGDEGLAIQAMREGALDFMPKTRDFVQALPEVVSRAIERGRIIRERIRTQRALERQNAVLQALNDVAAVPNVTRDPREILTHARDRTREVIGARAAAVHLVQDGRRWLVLDSAVGDGAFQEAIDMTVDGGSPLAEAVAGTTSLEARSAAGDRLFLVPLVASGRSIGLLTLLLDELVEIGESGHALASSMGRQVGAAVEHARVHADLARTQAYLHQLVSNAPDEVITLDREGRIKTWNAGAEAIYGHSAEEVVGQGWALLWSEDRREEAHELARRVIEEGETLANEETVRRRRDGRPVDILLTLSPLVQSDGSIQGASCIGKDVTYQRQLQAQLQQSEKMVAVGQLISGVAHELNNPLTGVLGYAQLVASVDTGEKLSTYLERIAVEAGRCQRIVQNLLTFARKHEPKATRLNLNDLIRETLDLRGYDLRVTNVDVVTELEPSLPTTLADGHQLQQVFINLINNAQQAMLAESTAGRLTIRTRVDETGLDGRSAIVVTFDDDGPGIPEELRSQVFDPFFTTKEPGQGTGLGLSLSYGIIQEHGGSMHVSASEHGGAQFEIVLPLMPLLEEVRVPRRDERKPTAFKPRRILVVDDEPTLREMFTDILERDGHAIETAEDPIQALDRIGGGEPFDVMIMDMHWPRTDGSSLYEEVRQIDPDLAGRIVFTAGGAFTPEQRRALERAGNRFLRKPFGVDDVRATVSSFFEEP